MRQTPKVHQNVCGPSTLPLTWNTEVTKQHKHTLSKPINNSRRDTVRTRLLTQETT